MIIVTDSGTPEMVAKFNGPLNPVSFMPDGKSKWYFTWVDGSVYSCSILSLAILLEPSLLKTFEVAT